MSKEYEIHPAANKYPMMTGTAWEAFLEDFEHHGQLEPVKLLDGKIIDGRHRQKASIQLKRKLKVENAKLGKQTPDEYVNSQNLHRRHLETAQRDKMILELRAAGKSLRTISETVEVPKTTVSRVIDRLSQDGTIEAPTKITGKDGRVRTATPQQSHNGTVKKPGLPILSLVQTAHIEHKALREILDELKTVRDRIKTACDTNPFFPIQRVESEFENIFYAIRLCTPHQNCPYCKGDKCKVCKQTGWVTKTVWENTPENIKRSSAKK